MDRMPLESQYGQGISITKGEAAAKAMDNQMLQQARNMPTQRELEMDKAMPLYMNMAYEKGLADQARKLAELQQFNGMQAQYQQDPGMQDAAAYEKMLVMNELAKAPRLPEYAPADVENIGYAEAVRRGLAQ